MNSNLKPKSKKNNIVIQDFDTETLIYDLSSNKAYCLNQTSAMIWQSCDGVKTIAEIAELLSKNLKVSVSEDFVWLAIGDLQKENLVEVESNQTFFAGKSRREVIRKIGFASMIALPVISSLVAPRSVDAQSSCLNQICTFSNWTQSNCCSNFRCSNTGRCVDCRSSQSSYASRPLEDPPISQSGCQSYCDNNVQKNLCCSFIPPATIVYNSFTNACGCRCP